MPALRTVALVQARVGSSRLPGKVLAAVLGVPMLECVIQRTRRAELLDELVVATSTEVADDAVAEVAARCDVRCVRGALDDVLDRFRQAAVEARAEVVVRLTADNPLVDRAIVDATVAALAASADYADTWATKSYPVGLTVEAFRAEALEAAWREESDPVRREHVTPFIHEHPERFRLVHLRCPRRLGNFRWTVDTTEDLAVVQRVFEHFGTIEFAWEEAANAFALHPEWAALNAQVPQTSLPPRPRSR